MTHLRNNGYGDRTIQVAYQRLKAVIGPDVAQLRSEEHPFPPRGGPRVAEPDVAFWGAEQVRRFAAGIEGDPHEALLVLVLTTALRQGEALGLMWGDLDTSRKGRAEPIARRRSSHKIAKDGSGATRRPPFAPSGRGAR